MGCFESKQHLKNPNGQSLNDRSPTQTSKVKQLLQKGLKLPKEKKIGNPSEKIQAQSLTITSAYLLHQDLLQIVPTLSNLKFLNLSRNLLDADSISLIVLANWFQITHFNIGWNKIGDIGTSFLLKSNWPNLCLLDIENCNIGPLGAQNLSKCTWLKLRTINLGWNNIQTEGSRHISRTAWPQLKNLNLFNNNIKNEGVNWIIRGEWPLESIKIGNNNVDEKGIKNIQSRWTGIKLDNL